MYDGLDHKLDESQAKQIVRKDSHGKTGSEVRLLSEPKILTVSSLRMVISSHLTGLRLVRAGEGAGYEAK